MYHKLINNNKNNWILLMHCICSNMHVFDDYINDLSKKYNIILFDLPGHGKSTNVEMFDLNSVTKEIVKVLDYYKIDQVDIWAISLGAMIANEIANEYPKKVRIMILEGAAFGLKNKFYLNLFGIFNRINFLIPSKFYIDIFINLVVRGKNRKKIIKIMNNHKKCINIESIKLWLKIMNDEYINNIYSNIKNSNKRIYLMGEDDKVFLNSIVKNIRENEKNQIIVLKDKGHLCHLEGKIDILKLTE